MIAIIGPTTSSIYSSTLHIQVQKWNKSEVGVSSTGTWLKSSRAWTEPEDFAQGCSSLEKLHVVSFQFQKCSLENLCFWWEFSFQIKYKCTFQVNILLSALCSIEQRHNKSFQRCL